MHDGATTWLRVGVACLAASFIAALLLPNGESVVDNKTVFVLESWIERTGFWLGLIFIAGYLLERVLGRRHG